MLCQCWGRSGEGQKAACYWFCLPTPILSYSPAWAWDFSCLQVPMPSLLLSPPVGHRPPRPESVAPPMVGCRLCRQGWLIIPFSRKFRHWDGLNPGSLEQSGPSWCSDTQLPCTAWGQSALRRETASAPPASPQLWRLGRCLTSLSVSLPIWKEGGCHPHLLGFVRAE